MRSGVIAAAALGPWLERDTIKANSGWVNSSNTPAVAPTKDAFYNYTGSLDGFSNGDVLRWRPVGLADYGNVSAAYQLLYRTESALGDPETTVTTVIVPTNNDNKTIVSYQIPEDSSYLDCNPSYELVQESADDTIQSLINAGHVVVSPDYEGSNSTFTAGIHEGKLTLDSVRAVLSTRQNITNIGNSKVALWGYSGGSIASGWAAELRKSYAPDVELTAAAVGGFVTNLTATVLLVNKTPYVGFVPPGILGLASAYPKLWDEVYPDIKTQNVTAVMDSLHQCTIEDILQYAYMDVFDFFKDGVNVLTQPYVHEVLVNNTLGLHNTPDIPLFVYQGSVDQIAPPTEAARAANFYCANGGTVDYVSVEGKDHINAEIVGGPLAYEYIVKAFAGDIPKGCVNTSTNTNSTTTNSTSSVNGTSTSIPSNGVNSSTPVSQAPGVHPTAPVGPGSPPSSLAASPTKSAVSSAASSASSNTAQGSQSQNPTNDGYKVAPVTVFLVSLLTLLL